MDGKSLLGNSKSVAKESLGKLEDSCYVCSRIEKNLSAMVATVCYLWESDQNFRRKFNKQPWFCLPHYRAMLEYASKKMPKRLYSDFYDEAHAVQKKYITELKGDVSWFCKKFDYRYEEEPWYNSKDSVQRTIKFLGGCFGEEIEGKQKNREG